MNTQQRLADIHMLVTYIKEHVSKEETKLSDNMLDEIGKVTLEISDTLKEIEKQTTTEHMEILFDNYKAVIEKESDKLQSQLLELKTVLEQNTDSTKNIYEKVDDIYEVYMDMLKESVKELERQRKSYGQELQQLTSEIINLSKTATTLQETALSKELLEDMLQNVETQLRDMEQQDKERHEQYVKNRESLEKEIQDIHTSYQTLSQSISSMNEGFETAVSRLDILLMQVRLITKEGDNDNDRK